MVHDDQDIVATFAVILVQANTSAGGLFHVPPCAPQGV